MSAYETYAEIWEPLAFVEENFAQLKAFVLQPLAADASLMKTTPNQFADVIAASIREVAEFYGMNPKRLRVTIQSPIAPDDQVKADLQKRVVALHKEFHEFILEHGIIMHFKMKVTAHGVSLNSAKKAAKTKSRIRFEELYGG